MSGGYFTTLRTPMDHATLEQCASAMYLALRMLPCRCLHNVPYAGSQVEQLTTQQCARCASMAKYEAALLSKVA